MRGADAVPRLRDALRTELWPVPSVGVVLALILGTALPRLDARVDGRLPGGVESLLFTGGADSAETLLDAIASSLITVTSLTFSLTVVTLQLASSQFSPRLLRTFTRDRFVHLTLALFLFTFTFSLAVLRTVRTSGEGRPTFVPQISVTLAFLLAVASVVGLVFFLAHLAQEIRVETMLRTVHADACATIAALLPADPESPTPAVLPEPAPRARPWSAGASGFLISVEEKALLGAAVEADAVLLLSRQPGSSLVAGVPMGYYWPRGPQPLAPDVERRLLARVTGAVLGGFERTATQDIGFGLRQLTDVAVKALSPGINDPTTAVHALGHASALLSTVAGRAPGPKVLTDGEGVARVYLNRPGLADLLDVAISQPRRYGAADPAVLARLLLLLFEVGWNTPPEQRVPVISDQLERLRATIAAQDFDDAERRSLAELAASVVRLLPDDR
ncbi:DUF2254 domain-containing protein [Spongisporangium articulatum]|uniref:DUF2254 domain-containing protein n=1 Tax=Spongisporangium articulatum TaxID=3362603 RepID=A0ABW8APR1_9ACTN